MATGGKHDGSLIHPLKEQPSCAKHPGQQRNVYCNPCDKELCAECLIPEHLSHDVVVLQKKRQEMEAKLEQGIVQVVQRIAEIDLRDQELQRQQRQIGVRLQKDAHKLQEGKQEAERALKAWYDSQLEELNMRLDTTTKRLNKDHDDRAEALKRKWVSSSQDVQSRGGKTRAEKQRLEKLLSDARSISQKTDLTGVLSTAADLDRAISSTLPTLLKLPASMGDSDFPLELSEVQSPDLAAGQLDSTPGLQDVKPQKAFENIDFQKSFVANHISQNFKKGVAWYLVNAMWYKQWKTFVGYDCWNTVDAGKISALPGVVDNGPLFKNKTEIRERMVEELDYCSVPEPVWNYFVQLYGLVSQGGVIKRYVIEQGVFVKYYKVEVYPREVHMCLYGKPMDLKVLSLSRVTTIAEVEQNMRRLFGINSGRNVRLWDKVDISGCFEQLTKPGSTLEDYSICSPFHVLMIEPQNQDGTWPNPLKP